MKQIPAPHLTSIILQYFWGRDQESTHLTNLPEDSIVGDPSTTCFILVPKAPLQISTSGSKV